MKDRKRRFETFSFYDRTGIEAHLKKMAEKGWMISEMTTLGWIYKRVEPESLTFAVSYQRRCRCSVPRTISRSPLKLIPRWKWK